MKKISYFMALAMVLALSCQKNEFQDEAVQKDTGHLKTLIIGITDEADTRVGFDGNNSFYWHKGDRIGVITSSGFKEMVLDDQYHRQNTGVFTGDFEEDMGDYVVYPYGGHALADGQLTYVLPSSYTYASIEAEDNSFNPPMAGMIDGGKGQLKHLASFFKISVTNIPAGGDDMKFIFTADKRITGEFLVDLSADTPVITTDMKAGNMVTINFSNTVPGNNGTFYIPAPLGSYGSVTAEVLDGDATLVSKTWHEQTVSRMTPKRGAVEVEYVAEIDGKIYKNLQAAIDASEGQTITVIKDIDLDAPLAVASGKTIILDLNGRTVSDISTSAATSYLMNVKSGADVTVKNGTLSFAATTPDTSWGGEGLPDYPGYANNTVRNEGVLTIENAVLENKTKKGGASYVIDNYAGAKLTVNEGSVLNQAGGDIAIRMFNGGSGAIDVTINGGTVSGYRAVWIQLASSNAAVAPIMNLTVNGGTLTSNDQTYNQAVYSYSYGNDMKNVTIDVSAGTFNGDIALTGGANKTNIETLNISGGTFNGAWGFYSYGDETKAMEAITLTGGTFLEDPSDYVADGYVAVMEDDLWRVRLGQAE